MRARDKKLIKLVSCDERGARSDFICRRTKCTKMAASSQYVPDIKKISESVPKWYRSFWSRGSMRVA